MWAVIIFVCLSWNFLVIKTEDQVLNVTIRAGYNCTIEKQAYTFTEGQNITVMIDSNRIINKGWLRRIDPAGPRNLLVGLRRTQNKTVSKYDEGIWDFQFLYLKQVLNVSPNTLIQDENDTFTNLICRTNVTIKAPHPRNFFGNEKNKYIVIVAAVSSIALVIILAQAAWILKLKRKAKAIDRHSSLLKKPESSTEDSDRARYSSDPGKKMAKLARIVDVKRESVIYEAPNELIDLAPPSIQPPTVPCTPRPDRIAMQSASPFSTLRKPKQTDRLADRPRLPLPTQKPTLDIYEEPDTTDEGAIYEPPPLFNVPQPQPKPTLKKKIPAADAAPTPMSLAPRLEIPKDSLKLKTKPPINAKPQIPRTKSSTPTNELEMAFKKRNVKVPVQTIPGPNARKEPLLKPKPPPPNSKQKHQQHVNKEGIYSNEVEQRDSSDEEWTYEPLTPYNMNIYNV